MAAPANRGGARCYERRRSRAICTLSALNPMSHGAAIATGTTQSNGAGLVTARNAVSAAVSGSGLTYIRRIQRSRSTRGAAAPGRAPKIRMKIGSARWPKAQMLANVDLQRKPRFRSQTAGYQRGAGANPKPEPMRRPNDDQLCRLFVTNLRHQRAGPAELQRGRRRLATGQDGRCFTARLTRAGSNRLRPELRSSRPRSGRNHRLGYRRSCSRAP